MTLMLENGTMMFTMARTSIRAAEVKLNAQAEQLNELQDGQRTIVGLLTTLIDRTKPAG
jgi:hypothetical protein